MIVETLEMNKIRKQERATCFKKKLHNKASHFTKTLFQKMFLLLKIGSVFFVMSVRAETCSDKIAKGVYSRKCANLKWSRHIVCDAGEYTITVKNTRECVFHRECSVLAIDKDNSVVKAHCTDAYSNEVLHIKNKKDKEKIDVDHIIPIRKIMIDGGFFKDYSKNNIKKYNLIYNDVDNLVLTEKHTNLLKSDKYLNDVSSSLNVPSENLEVLQNKQCDFIKKHNLDLKVIKCNK
jgi:hypothetical protein